MPPKIFHTNPRHVVTTKSDIVSANHTSRSAYSALVPTINKHQETPVKHYSMSAITLYEMVVDSSLYCLAFGAVERTIHQHNKQPEEVTKEMSVSRSAAKRGRGAGLADVAWRCVASESESGRRAPPAHHVYIPGSKQVIGYRAEWPGE